VNARTRLLALALLVAAGCHRPQPSPAYAQARADFSHLYAQELDDAYVDPAMADVEAALRAVPQDSSDRGQADALLKRIADGRAQVEAQRARTQQAVDEALAPPVMAVSPEPAPAAAPASPPVPDAGADAGSAADAGAAATLPATGMSLADFQEQFGGCFHAAGQAKVEKGGPKVTVYALSTGAKCAERFKSFEGRLVVTDASHVLGTTLASAYHPADGGSAPAPTSAPNTGAAPVRP
jgi:hypothetical protein